MQTAVRKSVCCICPLKNTWIAHKRKRKEQINSHILRLLTANLPLELLAAHTSLYFSSARREEFSVWIATPCATRAHTAPWINEPHARARVILSRSQRQLSFSASPRAWDVLACDRRVRERVIKRHKFHVIRLVFNCFQPSGWICRNWAARSEVSERFCFRNRWINNTHPPRTGFVDSCVCFISS